MITVDSRRCGEGKTYDGAPNPLLHRYYNFVVAIYAEIKRQHHFGARCLVVVPSVDSVDSYYEHLADWLIKEHQHILVRDTEDNPWLPRQIQRIHSSLYENGQQVYPNVQQGIHEAFANAVQIIIITQAAFLQCDFSGVPRFNYNLLLDEGIDPYLEHTVYNQGNHTHAWHEFIDVLDSDKSGLKEISINDNIKGNTFTDEHEITRSLRNLNYTNYILEEDADKFDKPIDPKKRQSIYQELKPGILEHWQTVWLACAKFEVTLMRYWMESHGLQYKVFPGCEFQYHQVPLNLYGTYDLTWSSYKKNTEPELMQQYQAMAVPVAGNNDVLILRNANMPEVFASETRLKHNVAGANNYRDRQYVSVESALNYSPMMETFLLRRLETVIADGIPGALSMTDKELQTAITDRLHLARTVYCFYQTIMRSCLRDGKPATVFSLDKRIRTGLEEFFIDINFNGMPIKRPESTRPVGRPSSGLTHTQRTQVKRLRKRHPELADMPDKELHMQWSLGNIK